jgi:hypothetical protein
LANSLCRYELEKEEEEEEEEEEEDDDDDEEEGIAVDDARLLYSAPSSPAPPSPS